MIMSFSRSKVPLGTRYFARIGSVRWGVIFSALVCPHTWGAQIILFGRSFHLKHCNMEAVRAQMLGDGGSVG